MLWKYILWLCVSAYGTSRGRTRGVKWAGMRWSKDKYKWEKVEGPWVERAGSVLVAGKFGP